MKQSKQINYTKYFDSNWNNIKNTWKGIKTIISITNIYYNYNFSIWGNTFLKKKTLEFLGLLGTLSLEIPDKTRLHPCKLKCKTVLQHPLEILRPKTFFWNIPM